MTDRQPLGSSNYTLGRRPQSPGRAPPPPHVRAPSRSHGIRVPPRREVRRPSHWPPPAAAAGGAAPPPPAATPRASAIDSTTLTRRPSSAVCARSSARSGATAASKARVGDGRRGEAVVVLTGQWLGIEIQHNKRRVMGGGGCRGAERRTRIRCSLVCGHSSAWAAKPRRSAPPRRRTQPRRRATLRPPARAARCRTHASRPRRRRRRRRQRASPLLLPPPPFHTY